MLRQLSLLVFLVAVQALSWTATPFNPASIPLAVRTPYLSAWLAQGSGAALNDVWPTFWAGQIVGWAGFVKVDGTAYSFLGAPNVPDASFTQATQISSQATDLVKQSTPFSYMAVSAVSTDGASHSVQVYSDISAEWVSGDSSLLANWSTSAGSDVITHQVQLQSQILYTEINDHTQYGSAYYSTPNTVSATYQTGQDVVVRAQFINNGVLPNTQDTSFRAINDDWPVFALAHDLGEINNASTPVLFSIGHVRDPALQYVVSGGTQARSVYFWSQYSSVSSLISSFLGDYDAALSRAQALDSQINSDASAISAEYAAVVELSVRQALGATEITISKNSDGSWNTSDILVFLKEISSDGNVNTVDVIFPAWPILLYLNPDLGKYLLEGLFRYQATGLYPNKWSSNYPNATGHNDGNDEAMPVEGEANAFFFKTLGILTAPPESGNMLIMALSYAQKSGDYSQLQQYTAVLDQWTQFLIADSLIPNNQLSTDDFAGTLANQTNLAVKGIVGIGAMSESIATSYVSQWQTFAMSTTGPHLTLDYGDSARHDFSGSYKLPSEPLYSWGLTYNLYGDKLLGLNLFPESIYTMRKSNGPLQALEAYARYLKKRLGMILSRRPMAFPWTLDWQMWTAAIVTNTQTRDLFINAVYSYAADGLNSVPLSDWYDTISGEVSGFQARPVSDPSTTAGSVRTGAVVPVLIPHM
ncbi:hypothetical protein H0H92_014476 [Tricholoma furcatifolium]|nr:hypothetical protein H0H92_014476 [Tricholoma furcatifolium]